MDLGPERVWQITLEADPLRLVLAVLLLLAMFAIWAWKWKNIVARGFDLTFFHSFRLIWLGNFINTFTPTVKLGGGFIRALRLRLWKKLSFSEAYGWVMADQISNVLGKALLFGLTCIAAALLPQMESRKLVLMLMGSSCIVLAISWLPLRLRLWKWVLNRKKTGRVKRLVPWLFKNEDENKDPLAAMAYPVLKQGSPVDVFWNDIGMASVAFLLFCLSNGLVLQALGTETSLVIISLAVMLSYLGGTIFGVMGGIGVTELMLIKIYAVAGIPQETATAGALLHRAIFYIFSLAWGGYAAWRERRFSKLFDVPK